MGRDRGVRGEGSTLAREPRAGRKLGESPGQAKYLYTVTNNGTGSGRTAAKVVAWVLGGILGLLVLAYVIDVAVTSGTVPRGTTVRDVEIGGLSYDAAE